MAYKITFEPKGVYARFSGEVSPGEIMIAHNEMWDSPLWEDCQYVIADYTGVEELKGEKKDAFVFAHLDKAAILSTKTKKMPQIATAPEIAALLEAYCKEARELGFEAEIFSEIAQAREWIGISNS